ncbi:MAG: hypothetical protein ABW194_02835 [Novosphingobium sp.]
MSQERSELLPCPNPWCDQGELDIEWVCGSHRTADEYRIVCRRCATAGPSRSAKPAAIAAWNTRKSAEEDEGGEIAWHDASQPAPEGLPVLALYRAFNRPDGKPMTHVVWWREGDWRIYPFTGNHGHVDRWRPLTGLA